MLEVSYNIVAVDDTNHDIVFDIVDGEFESIERANKYLKITIERDREENHEYDYSTFRIQKITRELI